MVKKVVKEEALHTFNGLTPLAAAQVELEMSVHELVKAQKQYLAAKQLLDAAEKRNTSAQVEFNREHEEFINKSKVKPLGAY